MFYQIPLQAGVEFRHGVAGKVFLLDDIGVATGLTVKLVQNGNEKLISSGRKKAFKVIADFDSVVLLSPVATTVTFFISFEDVDIGVEDGANFTVINDDTNPVPVRTPAGVPLEVLFAGTVAPVLGTVKVQNDYTTIENKAPVTIGTVAAALVSDATLKRLRIRNSHATAVVAIGGAGVTLANGAVQLQPGDVWLEEDAPGAAWFAISDTAGTILQIQGLK